MNKMNLPKIGIIGIGFVGNAIKQASEQFFDTVCIDVDPQKSNGIYQDLTDCEAIFVCVPSPSKSNGECDTDILNSVLNRLKDYKNVIISKTTATPDFYEEMQKIYPNLVHVPEFLTAANAVQDFLSQENLIIGGDFFEFQKDAERIIRQIQPIKNVAFCNIGEAALIKYIINSFLATKVVFMNEMCELAEKQGYDWRRIRILLDADQRIGLSHTKVPGPDSYYGFGGACFPKDTNALLKFAEKLNVQINVLESAVKKNTLLRLKKPK
jgi:UDPglucose 6-dehydrogenase